MAEDMPHVWVEPYDCTDSRNEPLPDIIVYQPKFREFKGSMSEAVAHLRAPLSRSRYHNAITKGLEEEIKHRTREGASDAVEFAIIGDMGSGVFPSQSFRSCGGSHGAGKSSLINTLLGIGMIARKVGSVGTIKSLRLTEELRAHLEEV